MSDEFRSYLFGRPFGNYFDKGCEHQKFEFMDFFAEHNGGLNRHMDYQNGKTAGNDFGASYSFLEYYDGKLFRVNLIMVLRRVCGEWIALYLNGGYTQEIDAGGICKSPTKFSLDYIEKMYPDFEEVKGRLENEGVLKEMKARKYIFTPEQLAKRKKAITNRNANKKGKY